MNAPDNNPSDSDPHPDVQKLVDLSSQLSRLRLQKELLSDGYEIFLVPTRDLSSFIIQVMNTWKITTEEARGLIAYKMEQRK